MSSLTPVYARDTTAAKLLDMSASQFRSLVQQGVLPPPTRISDMERWKVSELLAIIDGTAAQPPVTEEMEI